MKNHHYALAVLAGTVLLASSQVLATTTDDKTYPGMACRPTGGGSFTLDWGDIFNSGTTPMNISCPVVRDGSGVSQAVVKVLDRNPNEDLSCIVVAECATGTFFVSDESPVVGTESSYGNGFFGSNFKTLTLPAVSLPNNFPTYDYLECTIPSVYNGNYSHLISITVKET